MTQGDVTGTAGLILGTGATLWAAQMATGVMFAAKVKKAAEAIESRPKNTLVFGAVVGISAGVFGLVLANLNNGLLKLIGIGLLVCLLAVAVLGGAGLAFIAGERITRFDVRLSPLGAAGRGSALLIAAGFLPIIGWFLLFPLQLLMSVGAGSRALWEGKLSLRAIRAAKSSAGA